MLNEEKIRLMTGIATFEKKEGKRIFPQNRYFKRDYISWHLFGAFFGYTVCCILAAVLWALYHAESLRDEIGTDLIFSLVRRFGLFYVAGLIPYLLLSAYIFRRRYEYAKGGMRVYVAKLRRLEKRYEYQNKTREIAKEDAHHDGASGV